jgi:hypothetical protein
VTSFLGGAGIQPSGLRKLASLLSELTESRDTEETYYCRQDVFAWTFAVAESAAIALVMSARP